MSASADATDSVDIPNQEEFKNLIVRPGEICHQSCTWDTSKRIKVHTAKSVRTHPAKKDIRHETESSSPENLADSNTGDLELLDEQCNVTTFIIGAAKVWDSSQPMPPPSRFVRRDFRQDFH